MLACMYLETQKKMTTLTASLTGKTMLTNQTAGQHPARRPNCPAEEVCTACIACIALSDQQPTIQRHWTTLSSCHDLASEDVSDLHSFDVDLGALPSRKRANDADSVVMMVCFSCLTPCLTFIVGWVNNRFGAAYCIARNHPGL
eukprot:TRINITY_DN11247_c1_g1_i4.p2 TRINITY_DN11247_c1_g1~~TRINITY_DN11247_c1_g1_i4.p2  ORF type:complete len:144 (+),score=5.56 TRINITY_DN11247_c1_g1_i4:1652-2083(+)